MVSDVYSRRPGSFIRQFRGEVDMRILIVGAGAIGGYLGACLTRGGRDVTYLVRPARAAQLAGRDLQVSGVDGAFSVPARAIVAEDVREPFDVILVAVKSYSLDTVIPQFAPAVGSSTAIIPMLNGMRHMGSLNARFGAARVLCGAAMFSANLTSDGGVILNTPNPYITFGEQADGLGERTKSLAALLTVDGFEARSSDVAMLDMWEKWAGIAANTSATGLMRAAVGDILLAPGGRKLLLDLLQETFAVATAAGFKPRSAFRELLTTFFTTEGSTVVASPLRDIERAATTEGEIIIGPYADHARALGVPTPLLDLARCHFAAYEARRKREQATA
jgi:2-dehydropantoate 2-reductase